MGQMMGRREGRVEAWPGLCQGLLVTGRRVGPACRVWRQGLAARVQRKQWCSPPRAGNGSLGKPAGGEQIFSQRMLGTNLTLGAPCGGWTCGMLGGRRQVAPADSEERVSSRGCQSDSRARGCWDRASGPGARVPLWAVWQDPADPRATSQPAFVHVRRRCPLGRHRGVQAWASSTQGSSYH